jgi:hypothetical protein
MQQSWGVAIMVTRSPRRHPGKTQSAPEAISNDGPAGARVQAASTGERDEIDAIKNDVLAGRPSPAR